MYHKEGRMDEWIHGHTCRTDGHTYPQSMCNLSRLPPKKQRKVPPVLYHLKPNALPFHTSVKDEKELEIKIKILLKHINFC